MEITWRLRIFVDLQYRVAAQFSYKIDVNCVVIKNECSSVDCGGRS